MGSTSDSVSSGCGGCDGWWVGLRAFLFDVLREGEERGVAGRRCGERRRLLNVDEAADVSGDTGSADNALLSVLPSVAVGGDCGASDVGGGGSTGSSDKLTEAQAGGSDCSALGTPTASI